MRAGRSGVRGGIGRVSARYIGRLVGRAKASIHRFSLPPFSHPEIRHVSEVLCSFSHKVLQLRFDFLFDFRVKKCGRARKRDFFLKATRWEGNCGRWSRPLDVLRPIEQTAPELEIENGAWKGRPGADFFLQPRNLKQDPEMIPTQTFSWAKPMSVLILKFFMNISYCLARHIIPIIISMFNILYLIFTMSLYFEDS